MSDYFESANVNDIISIGQKTTMLCVMMTNGDYKEYAWDTYYRNDADNPTLFRIEAYGAPVMANASVTWPASSAAVDNPFGIEAVQGQDVLTTEEKALWEAGPLPLEGFIETRGIGL
jgi:hypothetical protein